MAPNREPDVMLVVPLGKETIGELSFVQDIRPEGKDDIRRKEFEYYDEKPSKVIKKVWFVDRDESFDLDYEDVRTMYQ